MTTLNQNLHHARGQHQAAAAADLPEAALHWAARRRNTFAAGRCAARAALRMAGHAGRAGLAIGADNLPDWPLGWTGSISHTNDLAAAAAMPLPSPLPGHAPPVLGIDLEKIVLPDTAEEIAATIMPEQPPGGSGHPVAEEVTRVFSAKEALYKALFPQTRLFREFSAARIDWLRSVPGTPVRARLTLTEDWGTDWPAGTSFPVMQTVAARHVLTVIWR